MNSCWGCLLLFPNPRLQAVQGRAIIQHLVPRLRLSTSAQPCCQGAAHRREPASVGYPCAAPQSCHFCYWLLIPHSASYREPDQSRKRVSLQSLASGCRNQGSSPTVVIHRRCGHKGGSAGGGSLSGKNIIALNKHTSFSLLHTLSDLLCLHN